MWARGFSCWIMAWPIPAACSLATLVISACKCRAPMTRSASQSPKRSLPETMAGADRPRPDLGLYRAVCAVACESAAPDAEYRRCACPRRCADKRSRARVAAVARRAGKRQSAADSRSRPAFTSKLPCRGWHAASVGDTLQTACCS
jgi:hypothetical protein